MGPLIRRLAKLEAAAVPAGLPPAARYVSSSLLDRLACLPLHERAELTDDDLRLMDAWLRRGRELVLAQPAINGNQIDLEPVARRLAEEFGVPVEQTIEAFEAALAEVSQ